MWLGPKSVRKQLIVHQELEQCIVEVHSGRGLGGFWSLIERNRLNQR